MSTDGQCNAQGLAHGRIRIDITYTRKSDGYVEERQVLEATAENGVLQGLATSTKYSEDFYDGGSFAMRLAFRDGCEYYVNRGTGQPDFNTPNSHWHDADCSSDRIAALRQAYLAGISPPAPALPSPVSAPSPLTPAPAAGADAWSRCISGPARRAPDGGIQVFWDMTNSCNTAVIVRYCFRAQFEAAGDPNLCRRREMRTHEIAPNGKLTFDFNLMPAGTVLTDGRTVTSNTLLVSGFACTGGNFPDAYFDSDGSFRSRGC